MSTFNNNRKTAILSIIVMTAFFFVAFTHQQKGGPANGRAIFETNCAKCHGADGTKGKFGAANLRKSILPEDAVIERINNGKRFMPSFKKRFTPEEIKEVAGYVKTLRGGRD